MVTKGEAVGGTEVAERAEVPKKTGGEGSGRKKQLTPAQYRLLTNPAEITHPVPNLVHPALKDCWAIHPKNGMALIFDKVTPVRQYNRDQPYRAANEYPFAVYDPNPEEDPNVTENDSETEHLNPYEPVYAQKVYSFKIEEGPAFRWDQNQTRCIQYGTFVGKRRRKVVYKNRFIPSAYTRVIHQLSTEVLHGDRNRAHEAQRRASYAQRVLNALGEELDSHELDSHSDLEVDGPEAASWRSIVLTPILQRHLHGIPDSYAPAIYRALLPPGPGINPDRILTISDVTRFYLGRDPTDASLAPIYFRNLVYRWEARWHLSIVFQLADIKDTEHYEAVIENQKLLIKNAKSLPGDAIPPLTLTEYATVLSEGIELPFQNLRPAPQVVERAQKWVAESLGVLRDDESSSVHTSDSEDPLEEHSPPPPPAVTKHVREKKVLGADNDDDDDETEDLQQYEREGGDAGQST